MSVYQADEHASHAHKRALERYDIKGRLTAKWFQEILRTIREGRAKLVQFGGPNSGSLVYDVPTDSSAYRGIVRVAVERGLGRIITILPPLNTGEIAKQRKRELGDRDAARRKQFFRGLRTENEDDNED